jgi:hypothetical protein
MFNVVYELDHLGHMKSEPKVGCGICRCGENNGRVRCFHDTSGAHALTKYLYFRSVYEKEKGLDCRESLQ